METLSILTATYNREKELIRVYESLKVQTSKDFIWIIIDDGSTDNTKKLINEFIKEDKIKIKYKYKKNGGKHTAVNYGMKLIDSKYVCFLDSDDYLIENSANIILSKWNENKDKENIGSITFLKGYSKEKCIGDKFPFDGYTSDYIECRKNIGITGDKMETFRTDIIKKYPFPEIENEKFMPEELVWNRISREYMTVYYNDIIYIANYQQDGYTKQGKRLLISSPNSLRLLYIECMDKKFKLKLRVKHTILYAVYSKFAKIKFTKMYKESINKFLTVILLPISFMIYYKWRKCIK